jgi:hypothetical protein
LFLRDPAAPARKAELLEQIARAEGLSMVSVSLSVPGLSCGKVLRQAISTLGLDGILFLLGVRERESPT